MTSTTVLARKYRPSTFSEVKGQTHAVETILNSIAMGKVHNTYLLSGTRGVGKTTIARIFAKTLNCLNPKDNFESCEKCKNCVAINNSSFPDIIEIDAASNRSIDSTRENIVNDVYHPPAYGKYKIYIIDEVHMLTPQAFATLLKTLEEPPEYAKFIMCTTDPHKVLDTIISRSLHFALISMTVEIIVEQLSEILVKEKIPFDLEALVQIANAGDGSMRDSLSLTDQAIALGNGEIRLEVIAKMLDLLNPDLGNNLIAALASNDSSLVWNTLNLIDKQGTNWETFIREFCNILHQIMLAQFHIKSIQKPSDRIQKLATQINPELIQFIYEIVVETQRKLKFYPSPRQAIEMACIRLIAFTSDNTQKKTLESKKIPTSLGLAKEPSSPKQYIRAGKGQEVIISEVKDNNSSLSKSTSNKISSPYPAKQILVTDDRSNLDKDALTSTVKTPSSNKSKPSSGGFHPIETRTLNFADSMKDAKESTPTLTQTSPTKQLEKITSSEFQESNEIDQSQVQGNNYKLKPRLNKNKIGTTVNKSPDLNDETLLESLELAQEELETSEYESKEATLIKSIFKHTFAEGSKGIKDKQYKLDDNHSFKFNNEYLSETIRKNLMQIPELEMLSHLSRNNYRSTLYGSAVVLQNKNLTICWSKSTLDTLATLCPEVVRELTQAGYQVSVVEQMPEDACIINNLIRSCITSLINDELLSLQNNSELQHILSTLNN